MAIRSASVSDPIRSPDDLRRAIELLSLLDAMGLLPIDAPLTVIDAEMIRSAASAAAEAGIGRDILPGLSAARPGSRAVSDAIARLAAALDDSPAPLHETRAQLAVFGPDRLAAIVSSSPASLRRYASGIRSVPDRVAARLHWLAKVVAELRGAYNDAGVRRWFERPRTQLDGRAPQQLLEGNWDPDEDGPQAILSLARGLRAAGGT
jgi:hypothetical protein